MFKPIEIPNVIQGNMRFMWWPVNGFNNPFNPSRCSNNIQHAHKVMAGVNVLLQLTWPDQHTIQFLTLARLVNEMRS